MNYWIKHICAQIFTIFTIGLVAAQQTTTSTATASFPTTTDAAQHGGCHTQFHSGVEWQSYYQNSHVASNPRCLDENRFTYSRSCVNRQWSQAPPNCSFRQNPTVLHLELAKRTGFEAIPFDPTISAFVSRPRPWTNECLQFGSTEDITSYKKYLKNYQEWFWLPIKRYKKYYPFVYMIPGKMWGKVEEQDNIMSTEEDCLIINYSNSTIKATQCSDQYSHLCIYDTSEHLLRLACPEDQFTTRLQTNDPKCYSISTTSRTPCTEYFRFSQPLDELTYKELLSEFDYDGNCRIQIDPFQNQDFFNLSLWRAHVRNISFVNWAVNIRQQQIPQLANVTATKRGEWRLENNINCGICQRSIRIETPLMFLNFDPFLERLELTVLQQEFLWTEDPDKPGITCYTTATDALLTNTKLKDLLWYEVINFNELVENLNVIQSTFITKAIYEVELKGDGPGDFWCDGLAFPNFNLVSSQKVVAYDKKKGVVYGFYTTYLCLNESCSHLFLTHHLKAYSKDFEKLLKSLDFGLEIEDVRVMEILAVNRQNITFLFHVSISIKDDDLLEDLEGFDFDDDDDDVDWTRNINVINHVANILKTKPIENNYFTKAEFVHIFYCVSEYQDNLNVTRLISARIGERAVIPKLCLNENFVLDYIECKGWFPHGAIFGKREEQECQSGTVPQITTQLFNLATQNNLTMLHMEAVEQLTTNERLNPTDLFLVGSIMRNFARNTSNRVRTRAEVQIITNVFSNTIQTNTSMAHRGNVHLNATNIILDNYERIICNLVINSSIFDEQAFNEWGVVSIESRNTITFIIDPSIRNVSGVALFRPSSSDFAFKITETTLKNITIRYLFANTSSNSLLEDPLLESATYFPEELLNRLDEMNFTSNLNNSRPRPPLRIILSIIKNDILFQPNRENITLRPVSRVITSTIPGYDMHLPSLYPILFRVNSDFNSTDDYQCGFWRFQAGSGNVSEWSNDGCFFMAKSTQNINPIVVCACSHLTNFAFLMTGKVGVDIPDEDLEVYERHLRNLDLITIVGCSLSLIGIFSIWVTALMFRSWREKEGTRVLLQLSLGIAFQITLILLANIDGVLGSSKASCITLGIALHYSVLVVFSWMLITAYLQYLRYVVVFGNLLPKYFFAKSMTFGWILPMVPIMIILSIDSNLYIPEGIVDFDSVICYPQRSALHYGVILPVGLIIGFNIIVFGMVIYSITKGLQKCKTKESSNRIHIAQLRLTILLFFLLGLTWIFGCLVHFENNTLIFSYLFCITATLQGFILFVYFIILDPQTRKMWMAYTKCCHTVELNSTTYNS